MSNKANVPNILAFVNLHYEIASLHDWDTITNSLARAHTLSDGGEWRPVAFLLNS